MDLTMKWVEAEAVVVVEEEEEDHSARMLSKSRRRIRNFISDSKKFVLCHTRTVTTPRLARSILKMVDAELRCSLGEEEWSKFRA